jgi:hypothetical protein
MAHENKRPTTLTLSPDVLDSIKREAARERRSISNMVERLVERALERRDGSRRDGQSQPRRSEALSQALEPTVR